MISVGKDFLSRFPHYAERTVRLTDGCVAVNHSPDLYVNERAAEIAPVRMTGNYGGEVLRRVRAFKPVQPLSDLFCPEFLPEITAAHEKLRRIASGPSAFFCSVSSSSLASLRLASAGGNPTFLAIPISGQ